MLDRTVTTTLLAAALCLPGGAAGQAQAEASPCPTPEARQFDFWIGEWDVVNRNRQPESRRWYETGRSTDRVYTVVDGCGIVEHWRGNALGQFIVGFSVRAWNPASSTWEMALLWPTSGRPAWGGLEGVFRHGRGSFLTDGVTPEGDTVLTRFTFSDITPGTLRWQNGSSRDGGITWSSTWIMEFTRRDPVTDHGLWNGVTHGTRRCTEKVHRAFDDVLGEWRGERITGPGDTASVSVRIVPILEGCAVMERTKTADGSFESFRVRAFEPEAGRWVEYGLDTERPFLTRSMADPAPGRWLFEEPGATGPRRRVEWSVVDGRVMVQRLEDRGGAWHEISRLVLHRRVGPPAG